jgi:Tfp pilus assembly protein PilF
MPAQTYMVVDPRRDHSMRIPRPHLTAELGTPNACSSCHGDQSVEWAVDAVEGWYGPPTEEDEARMAGARAIHAGRQGAPGSGLGLRSVAADPTEPGIVRATALALSAAHPTQEALAALASGSRDPDPMVRRGALAGLEGFTPELRLPVAFPLLRDSTRAVRIEAARLLAPLPLGSLTAAQQALLLDGSDEYIAAQRVSQDHPAALTNLGNFHAAAQKPLDAELAHREAIEIEPGYVPAYANLADLYRAMGRDGDGEVTLEQGLAAVPGHPTLLHARGLLRVRLNRMDEAMADLEAAAQGAPEEPRFAYVLAIALNSRGDVDRAMATIDEALARHVDHVELLTLAASILRDAGRAAEAETYLDRLPPEFPSRQ